MDVDGVGERERELTAWLRLSLTDGVGPATCRDLLAAFGLPEQILAQSLGSLARVCGQATAQALLAEDAEREEAVARSLAWAQDAGHHVLTLADADYPQQLLQAPDPPPLLFAIGQLATLKRPAVAMVGSRNATAQGQANAEQFAHALSQRGVCVVSGLALGIDAAAHLGALAGEGSTIAVVGTGLDIVYPARNRDLAHRIAQHGLIVSEFALGTRALAANFPRRNRIIAGLAQGTLVVEAALQSGSLITARLAGDLGREVLAIPGSIHSPQSRGCHALIKQGAKLVESASDVLEELRLEGPRIQASTAPESRDDAPAAEFASPVLSALAGDPVSLDTLAQRTGLDASALMTQLTALELEGRVARLPGGRWQALA
ncbi:DNA processing protein DprA [beta proteobacterium AAP99]|nr:DNA processing protein DprA [beta proteobacterium AAP99]